MKTIIPLPARGQLVDFNPIARRVTGLFLAGYTAGVRWLESGALESEADRLADFYEISRPGQQAEEATCYMDADEFLGMLASMHAQGHAQHFQIGDGDEIRAEFVRDYGPQWATWDLATRVFALSALTPFDDGLMTSVWHATRG